ncbi:MAG: hypothetical protein Q4A04_00235 [Eubacteriales bacterium]|nr:hypothetical protein [Eubacteriales bacterium]
MDKYALRYLPLFYDDFSEIVDYIRMTSLEEQQEVVSILDSVFDKEQQAKEVAQSVIFQIGEMKKSILARAFRGELGTNDPKEESAVELLKSFL